MNAFVLYKPEPEESWSMESNPDGFVPVVLHPQLYKGKSKDEELMPEQKEGFKFLWDSFCQGKGCILAHEMGLGKDHGMKKLKASLENGGGTNNGHGGLLGQKRKLNKLEEFKLKLCKKSGVVFPSSPSSESKIEDAHKGPIYPETGQNDPFVLFKPKPEESWNQENNPNGFVPVIVHSQLHNGKSKDQELMPEQKEGLQFLWDSFCQGQGCILAHEMGLGKTRTAITLIATLLEQSEHSKGRSTPGLKKCIILAPKNAVPVWEYEIQLWCPATINLKTETIRPERKDSWKVVKNFVKPEFKCNILIMSYDTFKRHNSVYEDGFKSYPPGSIDLVICDEAHVIKNDYIQRTKILQGFQNSVKVWIGMTGTPYQNNLEEFCNLINFFRPQIFEGIKYKEEYCKPITNYLRKNSKFDDDKQELLEELKTLILPALHYKANNFKVDKHEVIICAPLNGAFEDPDETLEIQHQMYKELTTQLQLPQSEICFYSKIDYLTKASIHPMYLYEAMKKKPDVFSSLIELYETRWMKCENVVNDNARFYLSGKIALLLVMMAYIKDKFPDEKVVIVSSSKEGTLQLIKDACKLHDHIYSVYDGDMDDRAREVSLKSFNENDQVRFFLLSLKAGGTALSLTRANHMILMDPDWNPAIDKQALARVYRPGQKRDVYLYRFLATGTIEETKFINQLNKEEFDKFFKDSSENYQKIQVPFGESDLLEYYPETKSRIRDVLDKLDIERFNERSDDDRAFAAELASSKQYKEACDVPNCLSVLKENWDDRISYAFHTSKLYKETINNLDDLMIEMAKK